MYVVMVVVVAVMVMIVGDRGDDDGRGVGGDGGDGDNGGDRGDGGDYGDGDDRESVAIELSVYRAIYLITSGAKFDGHFIVASVSATFLTGNFVLFLSIIPIEENEAAQTFGGKVFNPEAYCEFCQANKSLGVTDSQYSSEAPDVTLVFISQD
ncbi:unnamed protein product [Angiostrongylus costaricensis]|uniref:Uncharacterized protein n=1 Tax=Angiostrongylus costaricensis TaxID=334426 RepID=A0A158PHZ4_ANGCS|nr:unnamed protein product [Angiostrongylus costaricensis]